VRAASREEALAVDVPPSSQRSGAPQPHATRLTHRYWKSEIEAAGKSPLQDPVSLQCFETSARMSSHSTRPSLDGHRCAAGPGGSVHHPSDRYRQWVHRDALN
jgi:hypothetical protein